MPDKTFKDALRERIAAVTESSVFLQLYSDRMDDFAAYPWPAIELAIAILQDKPIVIGVLPGRTLPAKLEKVADKVIHGDPAAIAEGLKDYLAQPGALLTDA